MSKKGLNIKGEKVHVHGYVDKSLFFQWEAIAVGGSPLAADSRWVSAALRLAVQEYVDRHKTPQTLRLGEQLLTEHYGQEIRGFTSDRKEIRKLSGQSGTRSRPAAKT
jgi:hypothetical protein